MSNMRLISWIRPRGSETFRIQLHTETIVSLPPSSLRQSLQLKDERRRHHPDATVTAVTTVACQDTRLAFRNFVTAKRAMKGRHLGRTTSRMDSMKERCL
jgi:hypothetical protein